MEKEKTVGWAGKDKKNRRRGENEMKYLLFSRKAAILRMSLVVVLLLAR